MHLTKLTVCYSSTTGVATTNQSQVALENKGKNKQILKSLY